MSWVSSCALSLGINFLIPSLSKREFPLHFYPWSFYHVFVATVWGPAVTAEDKVCSAALHCYKASPQVSRLDGGRPAERGTWDPC